jgi:sortase B
MKRTIRIVLLIICILALIFSSYKLYSYWNENHESDKLNDKLAENYVAVVESKQIPITVDFEQLKLQCSDVVGWLYCEGTVINYPVVQAEDNSYYLRRMLDGSYNSNGTLFMDCRDDPNMGSLNTIIYGHHMRSGAMFAILDEFSNQEFYEEHPVMWFLTEQRAYRIDLISTFVTPSNSDSYNIFETEDELNAYVSEAVEKSMFITGTDTDDISQIMTLSTCAYVYDKARTVVIGKITAVEY